MARDKTYGVDIAGSNGTILRMGLDKPKRDRKDPSAPWCIQFWIKFRDPKKNKGPHAQFCIFIPEKQLRGGLEDHQYTGKGEEGLDRSVRINGVRTRTIAVKGVYESGNPGASTEVDSNELRSCLEDLFRRLDAD